MGKETEITSTQDIDRNNADYVHQDMKSTSDGTVQYSGGSVQRAEYDDQDSLDSTESKIFPDNTTSTDLKENAKRFH